MEHSLRHMSISRQIRLTELELWYSMSLVVLVLVLAGCRAHWTSGEQSVIEYQQLNVNRVRPRIVLISKKLTKLWIRGNFEMWNRIRESIEKTHTHVTCCTTMVARGNWCVVDAHPFDSSMGFEVTLIACVSCWLADEGRCAVVITPPLSTNEFRFCADLSFVDVSAKKSTRKSGNGDEAVP